MSYSGADVVQEASDLLTGAGLLEVDAPLDEIGCALVALIRERDQLRAALAYVVRGATERFDHPDRRLSLEAAKAALGGVK